MSSRTFERDLGTGVPPSNEPSVKNGSNERIGSLPGIESPGKERAKGLVRGVIAVLQHHRASPAVLLSFEEQTIEYLDCELQSDFVKRAKWFLIVPLGRYLRQDDVPVCPQGSYVMRGAWRRWAKQRLRAGRGLVRAKNIHLWYSFLQAKRACLPLTDEIVYETYLQHRDAMGVPDPLETDHEAFAAIRDALGPVLTRVRRTLESAMEAVEDEPLDSPEEAQHVASQRACYEASRAKAGQLGYLTELAFPNMIGLESYDDDAEPGVVCMGMLPYRVGDAVYLEDPIVVEYGFLVGSEDGPFVEYRRTTDLDGRLSWEEMLRHWSAHIPGVLDCTIQAVLEPLKVRVISKGNAVPYYLAKRLQKAIHSILREMDCFRLLGRPALGSDLVDLDIHRSVLVKGRALWCSIDYKAATDNLSARLSAWILGTLTEGFSEFWRGLWQRVLAPHLCHYPKVPDKPKIEDVQQVNGQLMGSILSFPVLCLANLGVYLVATAGDSRPLATRLKGVTMNGDDGLFVGDKALFKVFGSFAARIGLTLSPGKTYLHRTYANINSACFLYDLESNRPMVVSIPYLNTGLLFGQGKVMGKVSDGDQLQARLASSVVTEFWRGGWRGTTRGMPTYQQVALAEYISKNSDVLRQETRGRNLFIHPSLGGMGQLAPLGFRVKVPRLQCFAATLLLRKTRGGRLLGPHEAPAHPVVAVTPVPFEAPWYAPKQATRSDSLCYRRGHRFVQFGRLWGAVPERDILSRGRLLKSRLVASVNLRTSWTPTEAHPKMIQFMSSLCSDRGTDPETVALLHRKFGPIGKPRPGNLTYRSDGLVRNDKVKVNMARVATFSESPWEVGWNRECRSLACDLDNDRELRLMLLACKMVPT